MKLTTKYLIFLLAYFFSFGYGHSLSGKASDEKKVSNYTLPGYNLRAYYYGSSHKMNELLAGNTKYPVLYPRL